MKRKILLLTTIYPAPDLKFGTPSIHYLAREWVNMNYEVRIIHLKGVYPLFFYLLANLFRNRIASLTGALVFTKRDNEDKHYIMDEVSVYRHPIFKIIPMGKYSKSVINTHLNKIIELNKKDNFIPDIVIGHFENPQLEMVSKLGEVYSARTCIVLHNDGINFKRIYKNSYTTFMKKIDVWGFRSTTFRQNFHKLYGEKEREFICKSGIPEEYIQPINRNFTNQLSEFIFVGDFIKLKKVDTVLLALHKAYPNKNFSIKLIGVGGEETNIKNLVKKLGIEQCVKFFGKIPRKEVQNEMKSSECFLMVSAPEAFGLVYVEAMGKGCISIGSRGQGIDGIIRDGVNGFLCSPGNEIELAEIIKKINNLSPEQKAKISQNAVETAIELTNYKVAKDYINQVDY